MKYYLFNLLLLPVLVYGQTISPPVISHESGFYTDEFYLTITHPDPGVTILYTLDGSEPKIENLTGKEWNYKKQYPTNSNDPSGPLIQDTIWTYEYTSSIQVMDRTNDPDKYADISTSYYTNYWYNSIAKQDSTNVFKGVVLNAIAYKNGIYSKVITRNYFVTPEGSNRYSLPIVCLAIEPERFFGYENGLYVPGILFDQWRSDQPNELVNSLSPANFRASGGSSEIPLNFSYIVDNNEVLNHGIGLRLHGNGSRVFPNRSLRLYAKSEYGASNFNYPFFSNYSTNKFKRIILRNSGNDCVNTMFRDGFIQSSVKNLNFETQEYQPAILFINGEYFGIYNIRERFDDKYFDDHFDIDVDDLDHIENNGIVSEGDNNHYHDLMNFITNNPLSDSSNYEHVTKMIDPVSFTDFFITEIFINNQDWPHNNNEMWRKKVPYDELAEHGHDGRFRWLLKDLDISFGHSYGAYANEDNLERLLYVTNDQSYDSSTLLLRSLLENPQFKDYFINRFLDIINTNFKSERLIDMIDLFAQKIEPEIHEFTERWSPQQTILTHFYPVPNKNKWLEYVDMMKDFAHERPLYQINYLKEHFSDEDIFVSLNSSDINHGTVKINTIEINDNTLGIDNTPYPWSGTYFKNVPITLKAIPKYGYVFTHWSGDVSSTLDEITVNLEDSFYITANFALCPLEAVTLTSLPNLCENDTPYLLIEGTPTGGVYSIEGVNVTSFDPSLGAQTIIYSYEDQNGCLDSDTLTVTVHSVPVINAGEDLFVCETEEVTLSGSGDAISYSWNNGVINNTAFIPSILTGEYTVTGTDINGCSNTDKVTVTVNPLPNVIITQTGDMLTASSGSISYQWINCETNTPIAGATNRSFIVPESGNYAVAIGNQFGCNDTSVCLYVDFVGIDQLEVSNDIKVYPNPTSDKLFISFPLTEYPTLTIVDLQGKTVHSENLADNMQQYEIEVSHLLSGMYLINIGNKYVRFMKN